MGGSSIVLYIQYIYNSLLEVSNGLARLNTEPKKEKKKKRESH